MCLITPGQGYRNKLNSTSLDTHTHTLFLEANDLGVGAEAVPSRAVVNGLKVGRDDVAHGQGGDDAFLRAHRLHRVPPRRTRLQDCLLPGPGLKQQERFWIFSLKYLLLHLYASHELSRSSFVIIAC